jgi:hypothetical protein
MLRCLSSLFYGMSSTWIQWLILSDSVYRPSSFPTLIMPGSRRVGAALLTSRCSAILLSLRDFQALLRLVDASCIVHRGQ